MSWLESVGDWITHHLISAPSWLQLIIVLVMILPIAGVVAWGLLYSLNVGARRITRRPDDGAEQEE